VSGFEVSEEMDLEEMELKDRQQRNITYLRLSVTDRCNYRCFYCMPPVGVPLNHYKDILTFEEIIRVVRCFVALGVHKIRITGGEPLTRKDITRLIRMIKDVEGVQELAMTTNGSRLAEFAGPIREAGVERLNISLDTLDPEKFKKISLCGNIDDVLQGLEAARRAGFSQIKVNTVGMKNLNDTELTDIARFTFEKGFTLRLIELMPTGNYDPSTDHLYLRSFEMMEILGTAFRLTPLERKDSWAGPAVMYRAEHLGKEPVIPGGIIGFIDPLSHAFCADCNRVRLSTDGAIRPCLASNVSFPLREKLRSGASDADIMGAIRWAIRQKPDRHNFRGMGEGSRIATMNQIGG
jgi:cyclic pyranopterin phosphate synthase